MTTPSREVVPDAEALRDENAEEIRHQAGLARQHVVGEVDTDPLGPDEVEVRAQEAIVAPATAIMAEEPPRWAAGRDSSSTTTARSEPSTTHHGGSRRRAD